MTQVLLAIDTSAGTGVAVLIDGQVASELHEADAMTHAETIGSQIASALKIAGVSSFEVSAVAVGVGPGPFTGLRVGIAAAKMFAEGVSVPIFGVGSLAAAVFGEELLEPTLVLGDARRSEIYFALFEGKSRSGIPRALLGPGVKKRADLEAELAATGQRYRVFQGCVRASNVGLLALAQLAEGAADTSVVANYLRAPDAVPAKGKKVSG